MIPILYDSTEVAFTSNGICRLRDCLTCIVTEERNGIYECDFDYPVDGAHFSDLIPGRIIAVEHDESNDVQPFDIVSYTKPLNGIVSFHCVHISYRLNGITYFGDHTVDSLAMALYRLTAPAGITPPNRFTFETDKTSTGYVSAFDGTPRSIRQLLGGTEGSILDAYGGEYEFDKWTVHLWSARGTLKDFTIKYGVNLLDYNSEADASGVYTMAVPYWKGQDANGVEKIVKSGAYYASVETYAGRYICRPLDLSDKFETEPTTTQLGDMAKAMMESDDVWLPTQSITVNFLNLRDTGEYEQFEPLYKCKLCDSIRVWFPRYGVNEIFKIVRTKYDVLDERYEELELGSLRTSLADVIDNSSTESQGSKNLPYVLLSGSTMTGDLNMQGADIKFNGNSLIRPTETGTHNLWKYVKWSDGRIELWGKFTQTVTSYATNAWVIGHASLTNYPSGITNPIAVATCQKIGTGGGVVCYDYERTDYWSGIANNFNGTIAQGESRAISWYVYVNARWK